MTLVSEFQQRHPAINFVKKIKEELVTLQDELISEDPTLTETSIFERTPKQDQLAQLRKAVQGTIEYDGDIPLTELVGLVHEVRTRLTKLKND